MVKSFTTKVLKHIKRTLHSQDKEDTELNGPSTATTAGLLVSVFSYTKGGLTFT
jgi:hypothetical protein